MLTRPSEDMHLQSMQSLAAHLKLLLDSPEHLWRLLEKKMFLHAAWLFLLSRVVHRSLSRHGADEDDEGWAALGIDISASFSHSSLGFIMLTITDRSNSPL